MEYLASLFIATALAIALRTIIHEHPVPFYLIAFAVAFIGAEYSTFANGAPPAWARWFFLGIQHCTFAFALFTVVMLIGIMPRSSRVYSMLKPIRGELAIIASFLCLGHIGSYIDIYVSQAANGHMDVVLFVGFLVAIVLLVLLSGLSLTSFRTVRHAMNQRTWRRLQMAAYPFFVLVFVHISLILAPSALQNNNRLVDLAIYACVFVLYAIAKVAILFWRKRRIKNEASCAVLPNDTLLDQSLRR